MIEVPLYQEYDNQWEEAKTRFDLPRREVTVNIYYT